MKNFKVVVFALFCVASISSYASEAENPQKVCEAYAAEAEVPKEELASYMDECIKSMNNPEENTELNKEEIKD
jgi:hypothetical protein